MSNNLFQDKLKVVNLGLESFNTTIQTLGVESIHVDWKPPMNVSSCAMKKINENKEIITKANKEAFFKILSSTPKLIGMGKAIDVIPNMKENLILHSGPPITWDRMCGPTRGGIIAALMYEGLACSVEEAEKLAASGKIEYAPCHEHGAVGPMAGIISKSMPVFIIKNEPFGNFTYATMNEGLGKVLRYGAYSPDVIERLKWMENILYPVLKKAIESLEYIDLKNIIAQALHMGDEVHNRNRAATSLFFRQIAPALIRTMENKEDSAKVLEFINGNDHFFLNLSMAAAKAMLDAASGIKHSSLVTVMARNGTDFGVKISGGDGKWFVGKALVPDALYFPGFSKDDANPDIGDSAITETAGFGGLAIAASPAIVQFVGGSVSDAINYTMTMYEITFGENSAFQIPYLNFRGAPLGIDILKVIDKSIVPVIDTGVAHKKPGVGQVGAGIVNAPAEPFMLAYQALSETFN